MAEKKKAAVSIAPEASDKKKALEAAISKIEKDYGKDTQGIERVVIGKMYDLDPAY
ncbi:MAG: hypothetical protein II433_06965 [Acidaminococcaceae bacterium]|nr:hypothetical protein [Acidaminococcaceae bacterium]